MRHLPYSGKLSREKTFVNFVVLWLFAKVFSAKFLGMVSFGVAKVRNPQKFSPQRSYFHQFTKVSSLESFVLYGIYKYLYSIYCICDHGMFVACVFAFLRTC